MWLEAFLLVALGRWESHGYELIRRLTLFGFEALNASAVYRILRQLETDGLVSSGWVTSNAGPAKRQYSLTDAGRVYLDVWAGSLRGSQLMLDQFFSLHPPPPISPSTAAGNGRRGELGDRADWRKRDAAPPGEPHRATRETHDMSSGRAADIGPTSRGPDGAHELQRTHATGRPLRRMSGSGAAESFPARRRQPARGPCD